MKRTNKWNTAFILFVAAYFFFLISTNRLIVSYIHISVHPHDKDIIYIYVHAHAVRLQAILCQPADKSEVQIHALPGGVHIKKIACHWLYRCG